MPKRKSVIQSAPIGAAAAPVIDPAVVAECRRQHIPPYAYRQALHRATNRQRDLTKPIAVPCGANTAFFQFDPTGNVTNVARV